MRPSKQSTHAISTQTQDTYLYDKVAGRVMQMIEDGTLKPGERLPSLRKMSLRLHISIATVMQAYMLLERKGHIKAKPQSGFYVQATLLRHPSIPKPEKPPTRPFKVRRDDLIQSIFSISHDAGIIPLGIGNPPVELLPVKALNRTMMQIAASRPNESIAYASPSGRHELRRQIASRNIALGCEINPDDIVITNGATEALTVSLRAVAKAGDIIAVESPTYFCILQIIESLGMLALEISSCPEHGMDLDALEQALQKVNIKAVITIANFSNPTGSLMPDENKQRLVQMLGKRNIPLLEDDINGDLYFGDERPKTSLSFDSKGLIISYSSFSKTLAPGYRIGWIIPGRYKEPIKRIKLISSASNTSLTQLTIAEFLQTGYYDRHLRKIRKAYCEQVEKMRYTVARHFPSTTCATRPQGGFVLWIKLPEGIDSYQYFEKALETGISVAPGSVFSATSKYKNYIRLSCASIWSNKIEQAVETLGRIAHTLT